MDEIEQRLAAAMTARAELVTEESLPENVLPAREPRRWPALVAAAAVVLTVAGIVVGVNWPRADPPADPGPPPVTNTVPPTKEPVVIPSESPGPPITTTSTEPNNESATITSEPPPPCGTEPCTLVSSSDVAGDRVELWAAPGGGDWRILVNGAPIQGEAGNSFANSVTCSEVAGRPVCLVYTWDFGDSDSQIGLERRNGWRFTGATFPTPYGAVSIEPKDLYGNGTIEVVSAETMNDNGLWTAQVWRWDGSRLGCTPHVDAKEKLPGWPDITPDVSTLALANCWGG